MGDYYLSGTGIEADPEKASICYHTAAEAHYSAQAYWNLGWMHENGVAVEQDFHMAKRYYDLALEANAGAYLPVKLSLIKLRIRSYWNKITNGKVNSIREEEGKGTQEDFFRLRLFNMLTGHRRTKASSDIQRVDCGVY